MKTIQLSIIVPIYNAGQYLSHTLDSLTCQKETDVEFLLIDDGSTDASAEICEQYAQTDSRFKVAHIVNGGVSKARNYGLQLAKGEYVTFVDSDDWVEQNYCTTIIREMQGADLLVFNTYIHSTDCIKYTSFKHYGAYDTVDSIANVMCDILYPENRLGWPWNKAFRKDIIKDYHVEFPEDVQLFEDEVFVLRYIAKICSVNIALQKLYHYRISEGSLSCRNTDGKVFSRVANYIDGLTTSFNYEHFQARLFWQVMWLKVKAYKCQSHKPYNQFVEINRYYKSRLPIIRLCPARIMHVVFGHSNIMSYCLYIMARCVNVI